MPWQRYITDVATEVDPATGLLAYREVIVTVPRQSGKTTAILALSTHRALSFGGRQGISYTAQTRLDARKKWEDDWLPILNTSPFATLYRVRLNNGHEGLVWRNGSRFGLTATTAKSGHGATIDLGIADEAFAQTDARIEQSMRPAMITRPQPQLWIISTAGDESSVWLRAKVDRGRRLTEQGITDGTAYFEWSAPDGMAHDDPATWRMCMPALGYTVTEAAIRAECLSMPEAEFRRAYLNQWVSRSAGDPVISADAWDSCYDLHAIALSDHALAIDVTPDQSAAAIGASGVCTDGRVWVDVIDHRPGVEWVAGRLAELQARDPIAVVLDPSSQAGSLIPALDAAGVSYSATRRRDVAQGCGGFYAAALSRRLVHIGQTNLTTALMAARTKTTDDGLWTWARRSTDVDISPLCAVTLAHWAWVSRSVANPANNIW